MSEQEQEQEQVTVIPLTADMSEEEAREALTEAAGESMGDAIASLLMGLDPEGGFISSLKELATLKFVNELCATALEGHTLTGEGDEAGSDASIEKLTKQVIGFTEFGPELASRAMGYLALRNAESAYESAIWKQELLDAEMRGAIERGTVGSIEAHLEELFSVKDEEGSDDD